MVFKRLKIEVLESKCQVFWGISLVYHDISTGVNLKSSIYSCCYVIASG